MVGYHYDAQDIDPTGWLTGSVWEWAPVYEAIAKAAIAGKFTGSKYNANWVGTFKAHDNPLTLAPFGPKVSKSMQKKILLQAGGLQEAGAVDLQGTDLLQQRQGARPGRGDPDLRPDQQLRLLREGRRRDGPEVVTLAHLPARSGLPGPQGPGGPGARRSPPSPTRGPSTDGSTPGAAALLACLDPRWRVERPGSRAADVRLASIGAARRAGRGGRGDHLVPAPPGGRRGGLGRIGAPGAPGSSRRTTSSPRAGRAPSSERPSTGSSADSAAPTCSCRAGGSRGRSTPPSGRPTTGAMSASSSPTRRSPARRTSPARPARWSDSPAASSVPSPRPPMS